MALTDAVHSRQADRSGYPRRRLDGGSDPPRGDGGGRRGHRRGRAGARGRVDYTLRVKVNPDTQPVAVALIEAKAERLPPVRTWVAVGIVSRTALRYGWWWSVVTCAGGCAARSARRKNAVAETVRLRSRRTAVRRTVRRTLGGQRSLAKAVSDVAVTSRRDRREAERCGPRWLRPSRVAPGRWQCGQAVKGRGRCQHPPPPWTPPEDSRAAGPGRPAHTPALSSALRAGRATCPRTGAPRLSARSPGRGPPPPAGCPPAGRRPRTGPRAPRRGSGPRGRAARRPARRRPGPPAS